MRSFKQKQRQNIALNIRNAMEKSFPGKGSGKQLSAALGVAPSTVSHWINGKAVPSLPSLYAMSKLFGIQLGRLCDLPRDRGSRSGDIAFDMARLIAASKSGKGKRVNSIPADAKERAAIRLICNELHGVIDGAPNNG